MVWFSAESRCRRDIRKLFVFSVSLQPIFRPKPALNLCSALRKQRLLHKPIR